MILAMLVWLATAPAQQVDLTKLPPGCTLKTFGVIIPTGWFVTNIQDPPEGREGCLYILFREDKSTAATIHVESNSASMPLFQQGDPFEATYTTILDGLSKNMNVVAKRETFRNDDLKRAPKSPIERATMRAYDAEVPGSPHAHTVVIAVMRMPERFFTVIVVTLSSKVDRELFDATQEAYRKILNSISPAVEKK